MRKLVALAVWFVAASAVAGTSLQFGRPMPFAELRSGDPATWDYVYAVWQDGGDIAAVVGRATNDHSTIVRMTIAADGHADPSTFVTLPVTDALPLIAPMGDSLMAAWWNRDNTSTAVRLDRNGTPLTTPAKVDSITGGLTCNAQRCLLWEIDHGVVLDTSGQPRARVGRIIVNAVAGDNGFLIRDDSSLTLLDNDGNARLSIPSTLATADLSFDGKRYVIAGLPQVGGGPTIKLWTIDPVSGAATQQPPLTMQLAGTPGYSATSCSMTWNGSQYLLLATMAPPIPVQPPPSPSPYYWTATRLSPSFQPIDSAATPLIDDTIVRMAAAPTADGFRILFGAPSHGFTRTAFIRSSDGSVIPDADGQPVVIDRASQLPLAAASSRSAILGAYVEWEGTTQNVYASRIDRSGKHLDPVPISLGSGKSLESAWAASDGDGFLVLWWDLDGASLTGAVLDASGRAKGLPRLFTSTRIRSLNVDYLNGAYQLAFFADNEIVSMTVRPDGTIAQTASFLFHGTNLTASDVRFDGSRVVALWSNPIGIYGLTKTGSDAESIRLLAPVSDYVGALAIAPDGDGYIVSITAGNAANASLFLNRLSHDAQFVRPGYGVLAAKNVALIRHSLLRIDDTWFATTAYQTSGFEQPLQYVRELTAFNPATLQAAPLSLLTDSVYRQLVSGWNREGLAWSGPDVPVASGWARQMDAQLVHTPHPRAAGK